jgi:hypothetical protein
LKNGLRGDTIAPSGSLRLVDDASALWDSEAGGSWSMLGDVTTDSNGQAFAEVDWLWDILIELMDAVYIDERFRY